MSKTLSSWQRLKLKNKTGQRKRELEEYFGIATKKQSSPAESKPKKKTAKKSK